MQNSAGTELTWNSQRNLLGKTFWLSGYRQNVDVSGDARRHFDRKLIKNIASGAPGRNMRQGIKDFFDVQKDQI